MSSSSPSLQVLEKRQRVVETHKSSDAYLEYKQVQQLCTDHPCLYKFYRLESDDLPSTPRPDMYGSKRKWEAAMYEWRSAMKIAVDARKTGKFSI